ncbi:MAG: S8 family serine peptidase [Ignavibacteriota bacterium]
MSFCGKCGNQLNEGARFCPKCGNSLSGKKESVPEQPKSSVPPKHEQQPPVVSMRVKKGKSRKGVVIWIAALVIIGVGLFFSYNYFFSGPKKIIAEYKVPSKNSLVKLDSSGMAPANMFGVMLKEGNDKSDAEDVAKLVNGKIVGVIEINNVYQIEFDGKTKGDLYAALKKVKSSEKVDIAFPDGILRIDGAENSSCNPLDDPFYEGKDGNPYKMINLKQAWDIIKASGVKLNDVNVGVVDVNVNYGSDEFNTGKSVIVPLEKTDMNTKGELTHGTMVTEIIAANGENGGMTGVASILGENLTVSTTAGSNLSLKGLNKPKVDAENVSEFEYNGKIYTMDAMKNIQKQIENGATVINCSFGNHWKDYSLAQHKDYSKVFKSFLERTQKKYPNVIIVGTAGNDANIIEGTRIWSHKMDNLVTVGAVNRDGTWADYSNVAEKNTNDEVTVVVCGENKMEDGKSHFGTSFAAPQVTGVIALLRSINPKLTPAEIKKILSESTKQVEEKDTSMKKFNQQLLQADDAVLKALESATGKKWDKNKLLAMMFVDLKSEGAAPEFTITATISSASEKGTKLEIECTGGDFALGGDRIKTLSSAGSVSWKVSVIKPETVLSVKVTRLDTKACKTILVGGKIEAKDLAGDWDGGTCWDAWSTPYKIAESKIKAAMLSAKGEFIPMKMSVTFISESMIGANMKVEGSAMPPPPMNFTFNDGNIEANAFAMTNKYHFTGKVTAEGGKYVINGEWSSSNPGIKMNGRWKASKNIK